MDNYNNSKYLGLGKTIFNSNICLLPYENYHDAQILITERFDKVKNSGAWPEKTLNIIKGPLQDVVSVVENRDVHPIKDFEMYLNSRYPFFERLEKQGMSHLTHDHCHQINHHLAHAYSACVFSPFNEALVLVVDGAGSLIDEEYEYLTVYSFKNQSYELLYKETTRFNKEGFGNSIGLFYEKVSEMIFNSKHNAGKVMGLAPFGSPLKINGSIQDFQSGLDWSKQFNGKTKEEWESSPHLQYYKDLAATVQEYFEKYLFDVLKKIKGISSLKNLILTGGCAMNCTFNAKLIQSSMFDQVYIPPNPGDEGISLGCAWSEYKNKESWKPLSLEYQSSSRGLSKTYSDDEVHLQFSSFKIRQFEMSDVVKHLVDGETIAWIQGRSEVGPRALGNRSLLAIPRKGIKSFLNEFVKMRESFRPYGCSVPYEKTQRYFEVDSDFSSPFMSYAMNVRSEFKDLLQDVSHVDGTSRFQTVHKESLPLFYQLLEAVGEVSGHPILLNTSLNIMGQPIVETLEDAVKFMNTSVIRVLVFNNFIMTKD